MWLTGQTWKKTRPTTRLPEIVGHLVHIIGAAEALHEFGLRPGIRPVEHVDLCRIAHLYLVLEFVFEPFVAVSPLLDQRHLVAMAVAQQAPGEVRTDLAAACDQDVHAFM